MAYLIAFLLPGPGRVLSEAGVDIGVVRTRPPALLLIVILFAASYQVTLRRLAASLRRPAVLLGGLTAHLVTPFVVVPVAVAVMAGTGTGQDGPFVPVALVLVTAAPVAAGATVWIQRGDGDGAAMISIVVCSALLSPLTLPATLGLLSATGLLGESLPAASAGSARGLVVLTVALPCVVGLVCRWLSPPRVERRVLGLAPVVAMSAVLVLTYVTAAAAFPLLDLSSAAPALLAVAAAGGACLLAFQVGRRAARLLRLPCEAAATVTLACGMNNVSVSSVLAVTLLPAEPGVLLSVLVYGLVQKVAAYRAMTGPARPSSDRSPLGTRPRRLARK
ncbi:sodium-dependent transporter [Streptomyces cellulosae]|uniref:bile acid:sodium symporter family protein n=1 Tax=Streptomyces sp. P9-2 TaxID=3423201 RepID=UPI00167414DA